MVPLIVFSTLITHLFGGSAGREGTAIQYGASLADQFNRFLASIKMIVKSYFNAVLLPVLLRFWNALGWLHLRF